MDSSGWNYQFSRELSVRLVGQYSAVHVDPLLTSQPKTRTLNLDFLITYLVHPNTALYIGYNSNLEDLDPSLRLDGNRTLIRTNRFINDGRRFYVKLSYLFRL